MQPNAKHRRDVLQYYSTSNLAIGVDAQKYVLKAIKIDFNDMPATSANVIYNHRVLQRKAKSKFWDIKCMLIDNGLSAPLTYLYFHLSKATYFSCSTVCRRLSIFFSHSLYR